MFLHWSKLETKRVKKIAAFFFRHLSNNFTKTKVKENKHTFKIETLFKKNR